MFVGSKSKLVCILYEVRKVVGRNDIWVGKLETRSVWASHSKTLMGKLSWKMALNDRNAITTFSKVSWSTHFTIKTHERTLQTKHKHHTHTFSTWTLQELWTVFRLSGIYYHTHAVCILMLGFWLSQSDYPKSKSCLVVWILPEWNWMNDGHLTRSVKRLPELKSISLDWMYATLVLPFDLVSSLFSIFHPL